MCDVGLTEVNAARSRAFDEPPFVSFDTKTTDSSVRSIDKTMDHGQESTGSPPSLLPSPGPGRRGSPPRFVSWPSWSSRRPSDRAFRSASRSASPHIHARGVVISVRRSPAPSRCSSWRAERGTSLDSRSARTPRAEETCLVITQPSHIARAHVSTQVRTSLLLRRWVAALPGRGSHSGSGTRHPRCARGGCARALRGAARSTSLGVRHQGGSATTPSNCALCPFSSQLHTAVVLAVVSTPSSCPSAVLVQPLVQS